MPNVLYRSPKPTRLIHRGDPPAFDWTEADLSPVEAFVELDCSSIVPEGATWIIFHVHICAPSDNRNVIFRRKGDTNPILNKGIITQVAEVSVLAEIWVPCGPDRVVEYYIGTLPWTFIWIAVSAWII